MEKSSGCTCGQGKSRGKCATCTGGKVGETGKIQAFVKGRAEKMKSADANGRSKSIDYSVKTR